MTSNICYILYNNDTIQLCKYLVFIFLCIVKLHVCCNIFKQNVYMYKHAYIHVLLILAAYLYPKRVVIYLK